MTLPEFFKDIDFDTLKYQKRALIAHLAGIDDHLLDGLLGLIDYIQDTAVDILERNEDEVFDFKED